ncbi:MAG: methyltransferase domain-containing protein [bacterium]|nr:methyltransferase domain-containing protein [bacterium]
MTEILSEAILIKPRQGRRAKSGHPWLFSNEIGHPSPRPEAGVIAPVRDESGHFIGWGTYNPHSLVAVRLLSRDANDEPGSVEWFARRIERAAALRERVYPSRDSYRLVYGESDGLPGVVIDRYGGALAVQTLSAGMERLIEPLIEALKKTLSPKVIVLRNDNDKRELENLPSYVRVAHGDIGGPIKFDENGSILAADLLGGQKTGHFFDQADNREALAAFAEGARVLDVFSHSGAWAIRMLKAGARSAVAIDSSQPALDLARLNAERNGFSGRLLCEQGDAFKWFTEQRRDGEPFDIVITDPPAFARSAKQANKALRGYEDINRQAIHGVRPGGILCACSCSYFVNEDMFLNALFSAAARERRHLKILEIRGQAKDHPVLASMPESRYLKCVIAVVEPW